MLSKTDRIPLSEKDVIDIDFIDKGISIALTNIHESNEYFKYFETTRLVSYNKKYLIIQLRNSVYIEMPTQKRGSI